MQTRNTIFMAVLLVALGGFVYFYEVRGREGREEAERQSELLLSFDAEQVTRISFEGESGAFAAAKEEDGWTIVEPRRVPADGTEIDSLVERIGGFTQESLVVEAADDLAPFELGGDSGPQAAVTLQLEDGSELTLAVGKDTPVGYNLYVTTGNNKVYSAGRSVRASVGSSMLDLRDRTVLRFEESEIRDVEITRDGLTAALHRENVPGNSAEPQWVASAPFSGRADNETLDDLLSALHGEEAEAFVLDDAPSAEQLAEHGLDQPAVRLTLRTRTDASHTLLIGSSSEEHEGYFAMREGSPSIFVVAGDLLDSLPASATDLRNKSVLALERDLVSAISISSTSDAAESVRIERDGSDWRVTSPRPIDADASAASRLLRALVDLRAHSFGMAATSTGLANPELTLSVEMTGADAATPSAPIQIHIGSATTVAASDDAPPDEEPETIDANYVSVSGDDTVYLVTAEDLEVLRTNLFDLRSKTIVQFSQSDLTTIEVDDSDGTKYVFNQSGEEWSLGSPAGASLENGEAVTDLLWDVNYLRMEAVASEWNGAAPDLRPWGLAAPTYQVRALIDGEVVADLAIGSEAPRAADADEFATDGVYVRPAHLSGVYEVRASLKEAAADLLAAIQR